MSDTQPKNCTAQTTAAEALAVEAALAAAAGELMLVTAGQKQGRLCRGRAAYTAAWFRPAQEEAEPERASIADPRQQTLAFATSRPC